MGPLEEIQYDIQVLLMSVSAVSVPDPSQWTDFMYSMWQWWTSDDSKVVNNYG